MPLWLFVQRDQVRGADGRTRDEKREVEVASVWKDGMGQVA